MLINGTIGNYIHQLNLNVILLKYNYYKTRNYGLKCNFNLATLIP